MEIGAERDALEAVVKARFVSYRMTRPIWLTGLKPATAFVARSV